MSSVEVDPRRTFYRLVTDAGFRKSTGEAAIAGSLRSPDNKVIESFSRKVQGLIDPHDAEYLALNEGLKLAKKRGVRHLRVFLDSAVVVYQLEGEYSVKATHLRSAHREARELRDWFPNIRICWLPREWNPEAHNLADKALKSK